MFGKERTDAIPTRAMSSWMRLPDHAIANTIDVAQRSDAFAVITTALSEILESPRRCQRQRVGVMVAPCAFDEMLVLFVEDLLVLYEEDRFRMRALSRFRLDRDGLRAAIEGDGPSERSPPGAAAAPSLRSVGVRETTGRISVELVLERATHRSSTTANEQ